MKKCSKCKEEKPLSEFSKDKRSKDGKQSKCKDCDRKYHKANKEKIAERNKEYYEKNREAILEQVKEYRKNNKEKVAEKNKEYYENNKEVILKRAKEHRKNNKEQIAEYHKEYYENNKKQLLEQRKEYQKTRLQTDINFKLSKILRSRLNKVIKANQKQGSAVRDLGCSIQFLKKHLEQQFKPNMNWDNYGEVWNIDHIIPLCAFDLNDKFQFLAACYYKNLQPLYIEENLQKGGKYKQNDFENYLKKFKERE